MKFILPWIHRAGQVRNHVSENERNTMLDACFSYDEILRKDGHFAAGEALQSAQSATTLRWTKGKVTVTDGPLRRNERAVGRNSCA